MVPHHHENQEPDIQPLDDATVGYVLLRDYRYESPRATYARLVAERREMPEPEVGRRQRPPAAAAAAGW